MTLYGSRIPLPRVAPAHAEAEPAPLTQRQESLRARVCAMATTLHDRLVALIDLRNADSADKEAVRGWLFAAHPDEVWKPPTNRIPQWTGDEL
jgi:hypothetical protein